MCGSQHMARVELFRRIEAYLGGMLGAYLVLHH
jgi:hypothetical protein